MKVTCKAFNTLPTKRDPFWQVVFIPTISMLNSIHVGDKYFAVNLEWLFWSFTTIFEYDVKR